MQFYCTIIISVKKAFFKLSMCINERFVTEPSSTYTQNHCFDQIKIFRNGIYCYIEKHLKKRFSNLDSESPKFGLRSNHIYHFIARVTSETQSADISHVSMSNMFDFHILINYIQDFDKIQLILFVFTYIYENVHDEDYRVFEKVL